MKAAGAKYGVAALLCCGALAAFLYSCAPRGSEMLFRILPARTRAITWIDKPAVFLPQVLKYLGSSARAAGQAASPEPLSLRDLAAVFSLHQPCALIQVMGLEGAEEYGIVLAAGKDIKARNWIFRHLEVRGYSLLDSKQGFLLLGPENSGMVFSDVESPFRGYTPSARGITLNAILSSASPEAATMLRLLENLAPESFSPSLEEMALVDMELSLGMADASASLGIRARFAPGRSASNVDAAGEAPYRLPAWPAGWQDPERYAVGKRAFSRISAAGFAAFLLSAARNDSLPLEEPSAGSGLFVALETGPEFVSARIDLPAAALREALAELGHEGFEDVLAFLHSGRPRISTGLAAGSGAVFRGTASSWRPSRGSTTSVAMSRYYCGLSSWDEASMDELLRALEAIDMPGGVDTREIGAAAAGMDRDPFLP